MKDFIVNITTCRRPDQMEKLLGQIEDYRGGLDIEVNVYEDQTETEYDFLVHEYVNWTQTDRHCGKQLYWKLCNAIVNNLKGKESKLYLFIPDDFILKEDFFNKVADVWESIPNKIAMLPYMPESRHRSCWNNLHLVKKETFGAHKMLNVGYIDMNFVFDKSLLEQLNYMIYPIDSARWIKDPDLSSGVGKQITIRSEGKMYLHIEGLQTQVEHKSIMNPNADCSYPYLSVKNYGMHQSETPIPIIPEQ